MTAGDVQGPRAPSAIAISPAGARVDEAAPERAAHEQTAHEQTAPEQTAPTGAVVYEVSALCKTYRPSRRAVAAHGAPRPANDRVDLTIARGEVFGLLGPNGAGKSTLVRQLIGLLRPDAGSIRLFGVDVLRRPSVVASYVAYLPQDDAALADLSPAQALDTTGRLRGLSWAEVRDQRDAIVDELGLAAFAHRPIAKLSGGQRRLAGVGATLIGERRVLVLDEPTAGLDPTARRAVWNAIDRRRAARDTTVLLVTHNVLEAETVLDRVAILDHGRVIANGTPGQLKERVDRDVRLELAWRTEPPADDPLVRRLRAAAVEHGRRWHVRLPTDEARAALGELTSGVLFESLDDFTLATPSLEDVYVALGGQGAADLERE